MKKLRFLLLLLPAFAFQAAPNGTPPTRIAFCNPSFEDPRPRAAASPQGWESRTPDSTPDIMPGAWNLNFAAYDGATCVGLVAREDGTSEDIGQMLSQPLQNGKCYTFSLYLSHGSRYVGYNQPCRLRVWGGGSAQGGKQELLASSPLINHADWREYRFQFVPSKEVRFITLEVWYAPGVFVRYRGNILLDKCSVIENCDRA